MDAVEIILVFVSSGGAKAEKNLGEYAERALKMGKQFCSVVSCYFSLQYNVQKTYIYLFVRHKSTAD